MLAEGNLRDAGRRPARSHPGPTADRAETHSSPWGQGALDVSSKDRPMRITIRRILVLLATVLLALGAGINAAQATSPHFKKGGDPVCTVVVVNDNTSRVSCTATLTGLGNADLVAKLSVSGTAVYQCMNQGGNVAPGQNKVLIGPATSTTSVPADQIKNGNLVLTTNPATLSAPATVSAAVAGCANSNWTGVNPVATVTSISLVIEQPPGTVIFTCSASGTKLTGSVALTC